MIKDKWNYWCAFGVFQIGPLEGSSDSYPQWPRSVGRSHIKSLRQFYSIQYNIQYNIQFYNIQYNNLCLEVRGRLVRGLSLSFHHRMVLVSLTTLSAEFLNCCFYVEILNFLQGTKPSFVKKRVLNTSGYKDNVQFG